MASIQLFLVIAYVLVFSGVSILIGSLLPLRRLIQQLPAGPVRYHWRVLTGLIVAFIAGYLGFAMTIWNSDLNLLGLISPAVFLSVSCFVWLTVTLSLRTTLDLIRVDLLEREVVTDALTGASNRRYLDRRLAEEVDRAQRYGFPLSILLFDIDHFKRINDSFGHQTGDQVLIALARLLAKAKRETDVLTRYGGEEFLLIAPHTPLWSAKTLAERLRQRIEMHDFGLPTSAEGLGRASKASGRVTSSIGVASLGRGIDNSAALIKIADANLYRAKQDGRNRVVADADVPTEVISVVS